MSFTIPNIEDAPTYDGQSVPDKTDWACLTAADLSTGVISGLAVTSTGTLGIAIASGTFAIGPNFYSYAGGSSTVSAASATDRRDIVSINSSGTITVTAGTACGTVGWNRTVSGNPPVKPAIPANNVLLAEVYVPGTAASITNSNIIDKRVTVAAVLTAFTTAAPSSGVAFTPLSSSASMVYIPVIATTTGTAKVTMGPSTGAENNVFPALNMVALSAETFTLRVPAGWKVVVTITGTTVAIGTVNIQSCFS